MSVYWLVLSSVALVAAGNVLMKKGAVDERWWCVALAILLYNASNFLFLALLKDTPLGTAVILVAMAQLILAALLGAAFFGETMPAMKLAGLALAIVATAMVMISANP